MVRVGIRGAKTRFYRFADGERHVIRAGLGPTEAGRFHAMTARRRERPRENIMNVAGGEVGRKGENRRHGLPELP